MDLFNHTPFAAERFLMTGQDGREILLLIVRATYALTASEPTLLPKQPPPVKADVYRGDPNTSSIAEASDLAWVKPKTDIVVNGCAYTTKESRTEALVALKVGPLLKSLRVVGDRTWKRGVFGVAPSSPQPFLKLPLTYERAYGGTDTGLPEAKTWHRGNPVGLSFHPKGNHGRLPDTPVPNIEDPRVPVRDAESLGPSLGLGAIAPSWEPRIRYAGTYDAAWKKERMPLLPPDFDTRFFQTAPDDQQLPARLRAGEEIRIAGMRPEGLLKFRVPAVSLLATIDATAGDEVIPLTLDTLTVDCEAPTASFVWRGFILAHERLDDLGDVHLSLEEASA